MSIVDFLVMDLEKMNLLDEFATMRFIQQKRSEGEEVQYSYFVTFTPVSFQLDKTQRKALYTDLVQHFTASDGMCTLEIGKLVVQTVRYLLSSSDSVAQQQ